MNLNKDRVLNQINCFRVQEKYTDTVLKFSDGHIYAHWIILEAHGSVWWTLARDTNSDNIVEVILPEVSLAEGLVFVEKVYSSIKSLKILNPNSDYTVQKSDLILDDNNNNSYDLDIENNPAVELPVRSLEDKEDICEEEEVNQDNETRELGDELSSTIHCCSRDTTMDCRGSPVPKKPPGPERSTVCSVCGKTYETREKLSNHMRHYHDESIVQCKECQKLCKGGKALINHMRCHQTTICNNCGESIRANYYTKHSLICNQIKPSQNCPYENCDFVGYYKSDVKQHIKKHKRNGERYMCSFCDLTFIKKKYMKAHMRRTHTLFRCEDCHKSFRKRRTLASHRTKSHGFIPVKSSIGFFMIDNGEEDTAKEAVIPMEEIHRCNKCTFKTKYKNS